MHALIAPSFPYNLFVCIIKMFLSLCSTGDGRQHVNEYIPRRTVVFHQRAAGSLA